jgi:hypothetical protein
MRDFVQITGPLHERRLQQSTPTGYGNESMTSEQATGQPHGATTFRTDIRLAHLLSPQGVRPSVIRCAEYQADTPLAKLIVAERIS